MYIKNSDNLVEFCQNIPVKFNHSLILACFLTSFILIWNTYGTLNFISSKNEPGHFSKPVNSEDPNTLGLVSLGNYKQSLSTSVSNQRLSNMIVSTLPKDSCFQAYYQNRNRFKDDPIGDIQSDISYIPASLNKYVTAAIVFSVFSKSETLDTELIASQDKQILDRAYIKTTGDPSFVSAQVAPPRRPSNLSPKNTRTFESFAKDIAESGVKSINELVVETKWFALDQVESGWRKDKLQVGQIAALNIDEGFAGDALSENPNIHAANILKELLAGFSISVGKITTGEIPAEIKKNGTLLARTSSPDIETLVSDMLKTSNNVYAEQLLAAATAKKNEIVNIETRSKFVTETIEKLGIDLNGFIFENGSGYSTKSRLTCSMANQIIEKMKTQGIDLTGLASIANVDGTLGTRFPEFNNRLQAKTGTLDHVTALSGKLDKRIVFTFISNSGFSQEGGHILQESVVSILESYPFVKTPNL